MDLTKIAPIVEFGSIIVVGLVEYHYGWHPLALILTVLAGLICVLGDGIRRYYVEKRAHPKLIARTIVATFVLCVLFGGASVVADQRLRGSAPSASLTDNPASVSEVTLTGMRLVQPRRDPRGLHPLVNVYFQNGDAAGDISFGGTIMLTTRIHSEDYGETAALIREKASAATNSSATPITPHESQWFTLIGDPITANDLAAFAAGKKALYFAGSILLQTSHGDSRTHFCGFAVGESDPVHECPDQHN